MRVLYASHSGLPDQRIERAAFVARQNGHDVYFLGIGRTGRPSLDVFRGVIMLPRINYLQVVFDWPFRRAWRKAISRIDPDLVHANDIIAGHFTSGLSVPMVYDDHEYWSKQRYSLLALAGRQSITVRPFVHLIPFWERDILSKHVTVTVSERIAQEHRRYCRHVYVLHNYPLLREVRELPVNRNRHGIAYIGSDFIRRRFAAHRDMTGLTDFVKFHVLHGLDRRELYLRLTEYRYGLLPFKTTPYTKYSNSAKTFDYLNCGLEVLMTEALYEAHGRLPYTIPFREYRDIPVILSEHEPADPSKIMEFAHKNLVWERQQDKLLEAYGLALRLFEG